MTMLTQMDIETGLRQFGLSRGSIVEVHSAMSRFGPVEGGAAAVIAALMAVVGAEGTLAMSAYPVSPAVPLTAEEEARGITWKVRLLARDSHEKTGMGRIADEFSRRPDVVLGSGLHRVCAWGHQAEWHSQGYQNLLADDGWALLMGVGIDRCSSMHQADADVPAQIARMFEVPADIRRDYPADEWGVGYGSTPNSPWEHVWQKADRRGLIRRRMIGQAECALFKAKALVSLYKEQLRKDPYSLFGLEPDS